MPLEIQIQKNIGGKDTGAVTVHLTGSLDTVTAHELERQLAPVLGGPVKAVVFDRAGTRYHGKIKALADAAREAGLQF